MTEDLLSAEALLRDIAAELVALRMDDDTRRFHLKLLAFRGVVSRWSVDPTPDAAVIETTLESLRAMRIEVLALRERSGPRLRDARASSIPPARFKR
jgi:hypothetical protein